MRASLWLSATILVSLAAAPAAHAADEPATPEVIVARDTGTTLTANDEDGELCINMHSSGSTRTACGDPTIGHVVVAEDATGLRQHVGIAVPAAVATVQVRRNGRLLASGATVAGSAYRGASARTVRFALVRLPAKAPSDGLRVFGLDAAGRVTAVLSASSFSGGELILDRRRLLSGRSGPISWSLVGERTSTLTSSVLDLAHESISHCVVVRVRGGRGGGSSRTCDGASDSGELTVLGSELSEVNLEDQCDPRFRLLHGSVAATVTRVSVLLGTGQRRSARIARVPGTAQLAYALAVPAGDAIRTVTLHARSGRPRARPLGAAPLSVVCADARADESLSSSSTGAAGSLLSPLELLPAVAPAGPVSTLQGSPPTRVADGPQDTLCLAIGTQPFTAFGCAVISPYLSQLHGTVDSFTDPRAVSFVVPANVAAVRVSGVGGRNPRVIATTPGDGYTGRYAGHVRFVTATFASPRDAAGIDFLDAAGAILYSDPEDEDDSNAEEILGSQKVLPPRRIAGRPAAPSLWQTVLRLGTESVRCLALTGGRRPAASANCQTIRTNRSFLLAASCATRRLTVAVTTAAGTRVLADTGAGLLPVTLRNGAGVLTLTPRNPLRALVFVRGARRSRTPVNAPPAARECGWAVAPN